MFRKFVASVLLASVTLLQVQPALAQTPGSEPPATPAPSPVVTPAPPAVDVGDCVLRGRSDGSKTSTGGAFGIGVASGLLLGLIGTGIAYFAQGEPSPTAAQSAAIADASCRLAYEDAYGKEGKKKKRSSALTGGLIGTAVIVVAIVASGDSGSE